MHVLFLVLACASHDDASQEDDDSAATEPPGDSGDDGCDGKGDEIPLWYVDADGDGYGSGAGEAACEAPVGFVAEATDCDDGDAQVHPGATELCNAIDDDCDKDTDEGFDEDGDGHLSTACATGDDCDDTDAAVYGGAPEVCGDGRDNDCVGGDVDCSLSGDYDLADADAKIYGTERNAQLAQRLEVGDLDGDGTPDVLVGAEFANAGKGGGYVLLGPLSGTHEAAEVGYEVTGSGTISSSGRSIGIGDANGDGYTDVEFGAPYGNGGAFVQFGPITADLDLADASVELVASEATLFGHGSDLGDVNGDGIEDALVGAYLYTAAADQSGSVFVAFGPLTACEISLMTDPDVELYGSEASLQVGRIIHAGEDMDGDGCGDALIDANGYSGGAPAGGAVVVAHGPVPDDLDLADADAWLIGTSPYSFAGLGLAQGDVDGDGLSDALVGAPSADIAGSGTNGEAYVVSGPTTGDVDLADADVVVHGTSAGYLGLAFAVGDVDADGQSELLIGAPTDEGGAGASYLFYDAMPGIWDDTDAAARFVGETGGDESASGLAIADLDGNGRGDLLFGAPGESTGGNRAGALYIQMSD
jgi:hypothetical protein